MLTQEVSDIILSKVEPPTEADLPLFTFTIDKPFAHTQNGTTLTFLGMRVTLKKEKGEDGFFWIIVGFEAIDEPNKEAYEFIHNKRIGILENYHNYLYLKDEKPQWLELKFLTDEIRDCLICHYYQAAMTLTNHLLEKVLKLGLIYLEVGTSPVKELVGLSDKYKPALKKYDGAVMFETITWCYEKGLISEDRKNVLMKYKDLFRNPFSHAQSKKIFKDLSGNFAMFSFNDPNINPIPTKLKYAEVPFLQGYAQLEYCKANAPYYYDVVYGTIKEIEKNVIDKVPLITDK
ncbi:MAG: hypothetical protein EOO06_00305 [Chitinophagaceae bacterium]|nr:MAG: hypothetical protein EOO06_00305 [Chitinophagaceae bacterium]